MNVVQLVLGLLAVVLGVALLAVSRRRRLTRIAGGADPGRNVLAGVAVGVLGVGVLTLVRAF